MARIKGRRKVYDGYGREWRKLRNEGITLKEIAKRYKTTQLTVMRYTNPKGIFQQVKWAITG